MKKLIFLYIAFINLACFGQSGYLGSLNGITVTMSGGPSIRRTNKLNADEDLAKTRPRYFNMHYGISYSRVLSKKFEVNVGYNFTRMLMYTGRNTYYWTDTINTTTGGTEYAHRNLNFLDDSKILMHSAQINFKYYRGGSMAPTGKFYGLGLEMGYAKLSADTDYAVGTRGVATTDNLLLTKHDVVELHNVKFPEEKVSFLCLYGTIGRNYPITKSLLISVSTSFPVFTLFLTDYGLDYGFRVDEPYLYYDGNGTVNEMLNYTIKKYRRITFDVGLRYQI